MARRRKGDEVDGWLILDKDEGLSSSQAVGRVKGLLGAAKAGHAGTLDPLASGVLPVGLGEATKAMPFIVDSSKDYEFEIQWGQSRDTDDREGAVIARSDKTPDLTAIDAALPGFTGRIQQVPPTYSAIKTAGRRAYAVARAGGVPELAPRTVEIHRLERIGHDPEARRTRLFMRCGKGTYVRSLARDLGHVLQSCAYVAYLRRLRVGPFCAEHAISLEKLAALRQDNAARRAVLPVMTALDDIPALAVTRAEADRLKSGQCLRIPTARTGTVCVTSGDVPVAVAEARQGLVKPVRVFNL